MIYLRLRPFFSMLRFAYNSHK